MNFNQMVIREYLKRNPTLQDAPEVLRAEYYNSAVRGVMRWRRLPDANLTGTAFYNYQIPDLGTLFKGLSVTLHVWMPTTHQDIAQQLFDTYGVVANVDDIVPTAMSYNPLPDYVDLVARAGALSIAGSLRVYLLQAIKPLDELITVQDVDAIVDKYPLSDVRMQCIKKYYGYDFTDVRDLMVVQGGWLKENFVDADGKPVIPMNAPSVLDEMDGPVWQSASGSDPAYLRYNFCRVDYNGPTSGWPEANLNYTHVCVINPQYNADKDSERYATGVLGYIYLHYNM